MKRKKPYLTKIHLTLDDKLTACNLKLSEVIEYGTVYVFDVCCHAFDTEHALSTEPCKECRDFYRRM